MNGTGKTLTSIAIVGQLWKERRIRKVLIVAPLSILGVWEEEFQKFAAFGYESFNPTPAEFKAFMASESKRFGDVIKKAGLALD